MTKKNNAFALLGALCLVPVLSPFPALAQESGGVRVKGNIQVNANAQNVNTIATGSGNVARTTIGAVKGNVRQNTKVTVDVKNVSNVASGRNKKGCVNIGVVGADPDCK